MRSRVVSTLTCRAGRPGLPIAAAMLVAMLLAAPARAGTNCEGTVDNLLTYADGSVMIAVPWNASWLGICQAGTTWKGVSAAACQSWLAKLTTEVASRRVVVVTYPGAVNCSNPGGAGLAAPAPEYVTLKGL